jgi:hypothetical protein
MIANSFMFCYFIIYVWQIIKNILEIINLSDCFKKIMIYYFFVIGYW